jgi:hypothetical protein
MRLLVYCLYIYLPPRTPLPRAKALRVAQRKAGLEEGIPPQVLPLTCLICIQMSGKREADIIYRKVRGVASVGTKSN